jgi:phage shock protein PspC (stress-responsive transcriptional regulator)
MLGGVCGGLAEYTGIDPLLWRVGFVALTLAGGAGVLVYLALWLLMPTSPGDAGGRPWAGRGAGSPTTGRAPAGPRSPVVGVTLAVLLIALGVLVLLHRVAAWHLDARTYLGAALLVVALGLIVSAVTPGRTARGGLIVLGVVLSFATIVASAAPFHVHGFGDRTYHPLIAANVHRDYDGGVGDLEINLSDVDVSNLSGPIRTSVDAGVGDLDLTVPASADVRITVDHGLGDVRVFGQSDDDGFFPGTGSASWTDDGSPEFIIDINAGVGDVEVSRG